MRHVGAGRALAERARLGVEFVGDGRRAASEMIENHWLATNELAARLGLGHEVRESLYQTFERWDGKGVPAEAKGERDPRAGAAGEPRRRRRGLPPRPAGVEAAVAVARERSGTQFDPALVDVFCAEAPDAVRRHRRGDDLGRR